MRSPLPAWVARTYLDEPAGRLALLLVNGLGFFVGLRFYLPQLSEVPVYGWPLLIDSPLALALVTGSLLTLYPVARARYPSSPVLDVLNTLAFAACLKYGLWTAFVLNYFFPLYYPDLWEYFGILLTHLVMVGEAFLIPYYGRTSKPALAVVLGWFLLNDAVDYGFAIYPRLRAEELGVVPVVTVLLSVACVALAWYCMDEGTSWREAVAEAVRE
ncbi:DUF1405 domain-containing protein [Halospeciosus flavus]|uniref:DUF1405 domain-containing protein n=1 Tax=Halospeciosus flavus TaxID=3032283 RepID=A0ABD5Z1S3_9EURY|nr:DUF1405 domain-containing protein [Halospeciosus flavus]